MATQGKVLIVDDHDDTREMLAYVVRSAYETIEARNGIEA